MEHDCKFEERIIKMAEDISSIKTNVISLNKRINGSIDDIENHIEQGTKYRVMIICAVIGLVGSLIAGAITFGKIVHTAQAAEQAITKLQDLHTAK